MNEQEAGMARKQMENAQEIYMFIKHSSSQIPVAHNTNASKHFLLLSTISIMLSWPPATSRNEHREI
jgi:hypothetical protein